MDEVARSIYQEIASWPIVDVHSHINPHAPAARSLDDILGYHYYTELAHSAGMPKEEIAPEVDPEQRCKNIANYLPLLHNTVQYSWLLDIAKTFFKFDGHDIDANNISSLYGRVFETASQADWPDQVFKITNLRCVFLTNDFDDRLDGFDTARYVPCLRTDELVLKLAQPNVRERVARLVGVEIADLPSLSRAVEAIFERFQKSGARACAISLPAGFQAIRVTDSDASGALDTVLRANEPDRKAEAVVARWVLFKLAQLCADAEVPFDLMIGPVRDVYPAGVEQGRDLFDHRFSLYEYCDLFNECKRTKFVVSVVTTTGNQELASFAWIFPNVYTCGHWWYSNIPIHIARDLAARLTAVPINKQIGYYSDAYKLEFILPKFDMYRRVLARVLAEHFVGARGWSENRALSLARKLLIDNPRELFRIS